MFHSSHRQVSVCFATYSRFTTPHGPHRWAAARNDQTQQPRGKDRRQQGPGSHLFKRKGFSASVRFEPICTRVDIDQFVCHFHHVFSNKSTKRHGGNGGKCLFNWHLGSLVSCWNSSKIPFLPWLYAANNQIQRCPVQNQPRFLVLWHIWSVISCCLVLCPVCWVLAKQLGRQLDQLGPLWCRPSERRSLASCSPPPRGRRTFEASGGFLESSELKRFNLKLQTCDLNHQRFWLKSDGSTGSLRIWLIKQESS